MICLPGDLPEFIEVDCGALEIGESISLSQLNLPSGVESAHLGRGGEDLGLVAIKKPVAGVRTKKHQMLTLLRTRMLIQQNRQMKIKARRARLNFYRPCLNSRAPLDARLFL